MKFQTGHPKLETGTRYPEHVTRNAKRVLMTLLARGLILAEEVRFQTGYPKPQTGTCYPEQVTRNAKCGLMTPFACELILPREVRPKTGCSRYPKPDIPEIRIPETRNPKPGGGSGGASATRGNLQNLYPEPYTPDSKPYTPSPRPQTPNPEP